MEFVKYKVRVEAEFEITALSETGAFHEAVRRLDPQHAIVSVVDNPNQEMLFHECKAQRVNDQMICGPCGITWDIDDPEPPVCRKGK